MDVNVTNQINQICIVFSCNICKVSSCYVNAADDAQL
jgi:hypothetical protein